LKKKVLQQLNLSVFDNILIYVYIKNIYNNNKKNTLFYFN